MIAASVKEVILQEWSFLNQATFVPLPSGSSEAIYLAETPESGFVLKFYAATADFAQIQYEHSLLGFLEATELPFAIPVPIRAACGNTWISVETEGRSRYVALFPHLRGQHLDRRNLKQVEAAGFALAVLHDRLANFDRQGKLAKLPFWGCLDQIHPQISDPLKVVEILNLGLAEEKLFSRFLHEAMTVAPDLYATLPIQAIHADYITPNILVESDRPKGAATSDRPRGSAQSDRVAGIIDFEFATRDLRLFDCFSSIDQFASYPWKEVLFNEIVQAFSRGYSVISLSKLEKEAAISVWKLQRASSLVYWTGWLLQGKSQRQQVVDAVGETLRFETWLRSNESRFLASLGCA